MSSSPPPVHAGEFNGPLDLLLDEVRRQNVAIEEIELAPMAARFLEYVRSAAQRQLNLDIEWIHMAATLIQWKSRFLLASDPADKPAADPIREDLVRQLIEHRKQAAEALGEKRSAEQARFRHNTGEKTCHSGKDAELPQEMFTSVWDLVQQARELACWTRQQRGNQRLVQQPLGIEQDETTVAQMIEFLRAELDRSGYPLDGLRLLSEQHTPARRCCLFLGMLDMARDQRAVIEQDHVFGPFCITSLELPGGSWCKNNG